MNFQCRVVGIFKAGWGFEVIKFNCKYRACLGGQLEVGCGIGADKRHSRPADILVQNWIIGKPATFDLTV